MSDPAYEKFWMVWCPAGNAPTRKHDFRAAADREATRLAQLHPGRPFFVLKVVGGVVADEPVITPIKITRQTPNEIPF